jgi:endonuclease G
MKFLINTYNDTFLTSNISPQEHAFNLGVCNKLEQKVQYWATKYDGVYVITGGVLKPSSKPIGKEKVLVPNYFYKIILDDSNGDYKAIAFLMPHKKSDRPLYEFVVSIDTIGKIIGIDFFPKLDDKIESRIEKSIDYKAWIFN